MVPPVSLGSPTLLLLPTELERRCLLEEGGLSGGLALVETCGFGPVAAAARTMQLLARLRPRRVLLVGIAGSLDEGRAPRESARSFATVELDGVGAGNGEEFRSPTELGFPQWPGSPDTSGAIGETLSLREGDGGGLLTVCAASDSPAQARRRAEQHPAAIAEDMEGFAVALACALAGAPLAIVRGIANTAGERDSGRWRIRGAMQAARGLALELLERDPWGGGA